MGVVMEDMQLVGVTVEGVGRREAHVDYSFCKFFFFFSIKTDRCHQSEKTRAPSAVNSKTATSCSGKN